MGDKKSTPKGGSGAGSPEATRLESAEELRRAVAAQLLGTAIEVNALADAGSGAQGTRVETVDEIRKANAAERPATVKEKALSRAEAKPDAKPQAARALSPKPDSSTRLESVEEIRKVVAGMKMSAADAVPFRPARRPPAAVLTICDDGASEGEQVRQRGDRLIIGRGEGDVRIPHDGMMSSLHAEIVREADQGGWRWTLVDLKSTNGTYVRVAHVPLKHGTEILVGSTVLRFEDAALNLPGATPDADAGGKLPTKTQGWQTLAPTDLKASLVQVLQQGLGKRFFLDVAEQWIGRDASQAAIGLADDVQLNPRHAKVCKDAKGHWSIADAGSLNGVWLRIERHAIDATCEFQLGEQRFAVRVGP